MVLALAFATAAGLQGWHAHRSQVIDQSVIDARADGMAMLSYLACYERQLRRMALPLQPSPNYKVSCRPTLQRLSASDTLSTADIEALQSTRDDLYAARRRANTDQSGSTPGTASADTLHSVRQLGTNLRRMTAQLMPKLEQRIHDAEAGRLRVETYQSVANLLSVTVLALGSMLFVWRLTRRLSTERAFAQRVIDTSPIAILWKDTQGRLRGYNEVFAKFSGFTSAGEAIGKHARDLGMPENEARVFDAQERYVIEHGEPLINVQEQVGPPGDQRWLSISRVPMHDKRGRVNGVLITFTEESERIAAEQQALEMSGRLTMGLNAANGGDWEWNIQTHGLELSARWLSLFGYQRTADTEHFAWFSQRVHPDDVAVIEAALEAHFTGRIHEYSAEFRVRTSDGSYRWTLGCGRVVERDALGKPVRMQGINLDIEPAKQAELALREIAERADAANQAKSDFLATISHELRTPLSGVIGMTELLQGTHLDDRQQSLVSSCRSSSKLLLDLINGVLDFSKIEAGHLDLEHEPFSPERCVRSAAAVMALHAHHAGLELDVVIGPGLPARCLGDNGRLRQVLVNLMANAVKFTEAGRVRIALTTADRPDAKAHSLCFAVTDTGIGIPADKQATLFEPFVQTDPSVTRRYGGTGLGLSICRSLVQAMGGDITVDSASGRGSTFTATVPLEVAEATGPGVATELLRGRVRLTDPDPVSRPLLTQRLQALGLEVVPDDAACDLRIINVLAKTAPHEPRPEDHDPTALLLLSPVTHPVPTGESQTVRSLTKPCCDRQLAAAIRALLSGDVRTPPLSKLYATAPEPLPDPAQTETPDAQVLLVEDDLTNRQYLGELLRRQGVACSVATHGRDAIGRYTRRLADDRTAYRLVLMDYHLPEMDGWTATQAIRDAELAANATPAIVLGVTAAGGEDNRAAGTAAGIDGWLSKPIEPAALRAAIERYVPRAIETSPPLDTRVVLERCMGDSALLSTILDSFTRTLPEQVDAFAAAVAEGDRSGATLAAHTIKGAAGLVTASTLRDLANRCEQLEHDDSHADLDDLRKQIDALRAEADRCIDHAAKIRQELNL